MAEKKKIIFLIPAMRGGGAERVISVLTDYFSHKGHTVKIALFKEDVIEYSISSKVEIDKSLIGKCNSPIKRIMSFQQFLRKEGEVIVFSFFTMIGLYILVSSFGTKAKIVISERLDPAQSIPGKKWLFVIRRFLYRFADGFVFQTTDAMLFFDESIQKKSWVIPNPIKENLPNRYEGDRSKKIVTFARLEPQKNYPLLIDAFHEFHKVHNDYTLEIYGQGELEHILKKQVSDLELTQSVSFMGFANNIHEKVIDAAMFVLPSDYEGLSNSMLEAMAIGLPCICTDCPPGGAKMFIDNMVNGLLVPIRDKKSMVEAMNLLANDVALRDRISCNAAKIRNELSKEIICEKWLEFIDQMIYSQPF